MHVNVRPGAMFQYSCRDCGFKREGLLDHPMYSWNCPKCGGAPHTEEVLAEIKEGEQTPTNSVRDAIALNTLRNKFEEIYRVHGQGGASYLYQEMMREFDEFIAAQQHTRYPLKVFKLLASIESNLIDSKLRHYEEKLIYFMSKGKVKCLNYGKIVQNFN